MNLSQVVEEVGKLVYQKDIHSSLKQFNFKACLHAFLLPVTIVTLPFSLIGPEPHPLSAD